MKRYPKFCAEFFYQPGKTRLRNLAFKTRKAIWDSSNPVAKKLGLNTRTFHFQFSLWREYKILKYVWPSQRISVE